MPFATRFAPSPTGFLHLGHAFSALTAWDAAQAAGGRFVLRIEDIDTGRCRPEFEAAILEDLTWLGLAWEAPVRRQSDHLADYAAALERLGDVVLARKDTPTSYHLASVLDDAAAGITHVIRGEDLAEAAHLHVLLQALFDLPTPNYRHHRLILGPDGKRLAKRDQAATLRSLRDAGETPASIRAQLGL